jgi:hypothetical protein
MASIVFKSDGTISSIMVDIYKLGFLNQREEKSQPLSAIELIHLKTLFLYDSSLIEETERIS